MTIKNLAPLIVPNNFNSNIQIVCNYLKLRKENKINLNFPGITPEGIRNKKLVIKNNGKDEIFKTII